MSIKAVVFDLGNVLVEVLHARAANALGSACMETTSRLHDAISASPLLTRLETGALDARGFVSGVCGDAGVSVEFDAFCHAFCDIFIAVPEMIAAQAALRRRGVPVYLFSNTNPLHFEHLKREHAFMGEFDACFLSYEIGWMKPDARIYEALETATGLSGSQLLYIDDRVENVEAGAKRGWHAIHHVQPARTIEALLKLEVL